jgi:membrane associated rhomboid family serine protease
MTIRPFRDALVRALVAVPGGGEADAWLVQVGDEGAVLHLADGDQFILLSWSDDAAADGSLAARFRHVAEASAGRSRHFALVGGGTPGRELLAELDLDHEVRRHQVSEDGHVWSRDGGLSVLSTAARLAAEDPRELDETELARARRNVERLASEESDFAREMGQRSPRATQVIVAVCVGLFVLQQLRDPALLAAGAVSGEAVRMGQGWRLFSGTFLHGSLMHVAANMWSLWSLGRFLEPLLGWARFTVLYLSCALGGAAVVTSLHPDVVSVGASGAIFGLLGALAALAFGGGGRLPATTRARLRKGLWQPILINAAISFMPGIDALSHAGGALAGLALVGSGVIRRPEQEGRNGVWRAASLIAAGLAAACIAVAVRTAFEWPAGPLRGHEEVDGP